MKCSLGAVHPARGRETLCGHAHRCAGRRAHEAAKQSVAALSGPRNQRAAPLRRRVSRAASRPRSTSTAPPVPGHVSQRPRWGCSADREPACAGALDARRRGALRAAPIGRGEAGRDPLPRALQKPVDDLHDRRAVAQHRERVDEPLEPVVALDQRGRGPPRRRPGRSCSRSPGAPPSALVGQQVDDAVHERSPAAPAARAPSANANGYSRRTRTAPASRAAGAAASAPAMQRGDLARAPRRSCACPARARAPPTCSGAGARGARNRAARAARARASRAPAPRGPRRRRPSATRRALLAHAQHPFQVVAVAAALELLQRGVAERRSARAPPAVRASRAERGSSAPAAAGAARRASTAPRRYDGTGGAPVRHAAAIEHARRRCWAGSCSQQPHPRLAGDRQVVRAACRRRRRARPVRGRPPAPAPSQEIMVAAWRSLGPALELDRAAQQQPLAGAGHGDVQDPVLLLGLRPPALLGDSSS